MSDVSGNESGQQDDHAPPIVVAQASSRAEAELIAGLLSTGGITAAIVADDAGGVEPQSQLSGAQVLTAAADARRAWALLDDSSR